MLLPVKIPKTIKDKQEGLLSYNFPPNNWGMLFQNVSAIHTVGMKFPIDVVFLDYRYNILGYKLCPPGLTNVTHPQTKHILELASGTIKNLNVQFPTRCAVIMLKNIPYIKFLKN